MIVEIKRVTFDPTLFMGMPEVNRDPRRIITELVLTEVVPPNEETEGEEGEIECTTCIQVIAAGLPLGNHYHTEDEPFKGRGHGKLYLVPEGGDLSKPEVYELPADGWEVTVPAGVVHTFVFDGEPDADGTIATLVSIRGWRFDEGHNTFRREIAIPAAA